LRADARKSNTGCGEFLLTGWDLDIFDGVDTNNTSDGDVGAEIFLRGPQLRATDKELSWAPSMESEEKLRTT